MKKTPLFLSLLLLASAMTACGESETQTPLTTDSTVTETEAVTEAVDPRPELGLEDRDFGGKTCRISCFYQDDMNSLYADSQNGEPVNDAVYERQSALQSKYNFTLYSEITNPNCYEHANDLRRLILAGDDAFELIFGHCVYSVNNAVSGYYRNLYDIPNLDFSQPWWPQQSVAEMTVYNAMYTIPAGYRQLADAKCVFFNKEFLAANDIETPYRLVRDGTWTIDKLISLTKGLYSDVNGDSKRDEGDLYGYATDPRINGFLVSCNTPVLSPTDDGGREITVMTERTVSLVEQVYNWYYESGDVFLKEDTTQETDDSRGLFGRGQAAFAFSRVGYASQYYRNDDISYGIVPQPKFDENQENYYVFACPSMYSIPTTTQDTDFAGFVLEAMTYYGYYDVVPAYYEITVKGKIADAPDDVEMLTLINDRLTVSFAYCYDNWEGFAHLFNECMGFTAEKGSKDLASVYEKRLKKAQKRLDTVLKAFAEIEG